LTILSLFRNVIQVLDCCNDIRVWRWIRLCKGHVQAAETAKAVNQWQNSEYSWWCNQCWH